MGLMFQSGRLLTQVLIQESTLLSGSYPIYVTHGDTTLVILPIGAYNELRYGTALFSSCAEENNLLQRAVIVNEVWKDDYKLLYSNSQEALRISEEKGLRYKEGRDECRVEYSTLYVYTQELEGRFKGANRERWIWRGLAVLGAVFIVVK